MKIMHTNVPATPAELFEYLKTYLNPLFKKRRQMNLEFGLVRVGDAIEIHNDALYDGYLFSITAAGTEIAVSISEHYTDDINAITLDSIMYNLFKEFPADVMVDTEA